MEKFTRRDISANRPASQLGGLPRYGRQLRAMTGKYRARNPALVAALAILDLLGRFHSELEALLPRERPVRVLVANWAHLGDVVTILPLLQFLANHPRIGGIGVLVGSWSQCVVAGLPFIERIHSLDHFLLDRGPDSRIQKIRSYYKNRSKVVNDIKNSHYDVSIDTFAVFPPTHHLTWKAGIPTRIGFSCTGLGTYLTNPIEWDTSDELILSKQLKMLEPIIGGEIPKTLPSSYPGFVPSTLPDEPKMPDRRYVLMHIGSGDYRSWPLPNWLELGRALKERGKDIVLTGAKGGEAKIAKEVADILGVRSVAGDLSWNEFVTVVSKAAAVISVDTVTGHVAACFGVPSIILLSGRWGNKLFRPNNPNAITLTHPVGCAPCYRSTGCAAMACVKCISVANALSAFDEIEET
jgi:ADP-heptose:LPS heptosyltransferase